MAFSSDVALALKEADRIIGSLTGGSHFHIYMYLHTTVAKLAPRTDSFYIGLIREDKMIFPYTLDGEEIAAPNDHKFSDHGITAFIIEHKRAYWTGKDDPLLLRKAIPFGKKELSEESIVAPICKPLPDGNKQVVGVIGILSYDKDCYTSEMVEAMEWLGNLVGIVFAREDEDKQRQRELGQEEAVDSTQLLRDIIAAIVDKLARLKKQVKAISDILSDENEVAKQKLNELQRECEIHQADTIEMLLKYVLDQSNPLSCLAPREREVAGCFEKHMTNKEIAKQLGITEATVKKHCSSIFRKTGIGGRTGVAERLQNSSSHGSST